jgi:hypothetical protein
MTIVIVVMFFIVAGSFLSGFWHVAAPRRSVHTEVTRPDARFEEVTRTDARFYEVTQPAFSTIDADTLSLLLDRMATVSPVGALPELYARANDPHLSKAELLEIAALAVICAQACD